MGSREANAAQTRVLNIVWARLLRVSRGVEYRVLSKVEVQRCQWEVQLLKYAMQRSDVVGKSGNRKYGVDGRTTTTWTYTPEAGLPVVESPPHCKAERYLQASTRTSDASNLLDRTQGMQRGPACSIQGRTHSDSIHLMKRDRCRSGATVSSTGREKVQFPFHTYGGRG